MRRIKIKDAYKNIDNLYEKLDLYWSFVVPDQLKRWTRTAFDPNFISKCFDTDLGERRIEMRKFKISWNKHCIRIKYRIPDNKISPVLFTINIVQGSNITICGKCEMTPKEIYLALVEINQIMDNYFEKCRECTDLVKEGF